MVCTTSCSIAAVFFIAMIYQSFSMDRCDMYHRFMDTLSPSQQEKYKKITRERRMIYLSGYVVGLILSIIYLQFFHAEEKVSYSLLCMVMAITFLTSYFFYILYPKSELMIVKLDEERQRKQWVAIYKKMSYHYHFGMLLGIVAVLFLTKGLCGSNTGSIPA